MQMEYISDYYQTKDLNLAAFLFFQDIPFEGLERHDNYYLFTFSRRDECVEFERAYWKDALVSVLDFCNAQRVLKSRLHQEKQSKRVGDSINA